MRMYLMLLLLFCGLTSAPRTFAQEASNSMRINEMVSFLEPGWGLSYFNIASVDTAVANYGQYASASIYQYLGVNYRVSASEKLSLRFPMTVRTPGDDLIPSGRQVSNEFGTSSNDLFAVYTNYNLATLPGDWELMGYFYSYLPTSSSSQDKKWITRLRAWLKSEKALDSYWSVSYNFKPEYFVNTQQAYRSEVNFVGDDGNDVNLVRAMNNKIGEVDHYFELSRYVNSTLTPHASLGLVHQWSFASTQVERSPNRNTPLRSLTESVKVGLATWINVNRQLSFRVGVDNEVNINNKKLTEVAYLKNEEMQYFLMTFWSIL